MKWNDFLKANQESIAQNYIIKKSEWHSFKSPFRKDSSPSCGIFLNKQGFLIYNDFKQGGLRLDRALLKEKVFKDFEDMKSTLYTLHNVSYEKFDKSYIDFNLNKKNTLETRLSTSFTDEDLNCLHQKKIKPEYHYNNHIIYVDYKEYKKKPSTEEVSEITKRFKENILFPIEVTNASSIDLLTKGQSIIPCIFDIEKGEKVFKQQSLFLLDFDDTITIEDFKKLLIKYKIECVGIYETFGNKVDTPKFRVLFQFESIIKNLDIREWIMLKFIKLFPCDSKCRNMNRIFYGTNKEAVYFNKKNYKINLNKFLML